MRKCHKYKGNEMRKSFIQRTGKKISGDRKIKQTFKMIKETDIFIAGNSFNKGPSKASTQLSSLQRE